MVALCALGEGCACSLRAEPYCLPASECVSDAAPLACCIALAPPPKAEHAVLSPIATLPKLAVRLCAREAGLRNWDLAASPCLRSRLALGVRATSSALRAVGEAEAHARRALDLAHTSDLRVRLLSDPDPAAGEPGVAVLEVPADVEPKARAALVELRECIPSNLDLVAVRAFQSGAVATAEGTAKAALLAAGLTEATDDMTKH